MAVIRASHYAETVAALRKDKIIQDMAEGLASIPTGDLAHESGAPRHEFMGAANAEYRKRGGTYSGPKSIGAVAEALLSIRETPLTKVEQMEAFSTEDLKIMLQAAEKASWKIPADLIPSIRTVLASRES